MSNNPPDVSLELTNDEAKFLLHNCDSNLVFALSALDKLQDRANIERMVVLMEQFKAIRAKLIAQGVKPD